MINFREHFGLEVPEIQVPRLLQIWMRDMALPRMLLNSEFLNQHR